jgi:type III pantothenate kinase
MARLVIDIGNTLVKLAVFKGPVLLEAGHYSTANDDCLQQLLGKHQITQAIFSSVKQEPVSTAN